MAVLRLILVALLIAAAVAFGAFLNLLPATMGRGAIGDARMRLCRLGCRLLGISVAHEGPVPVSAPTLLVANHVSWTDVLAFGSLAPISFLARHDVAHWPALGPLARAYGTLFVERGRLRQIPRVNAQMADQMEKGEIVALFPEATTGDGTRLKRFHAVHFAAARDLLRVRPDIASVLVAPAAIAYTRRRGMPLGRAGRSVVAWYGDTAFAPHLLDLARGGKIDCRISFLEPIDFTRASNRKDIARLAETAVRREVARLLCEPTPVATGPYVLSDQQGV